MQYTHTHSNTSPRKTFSNYIYNSIKYIFAKYTTNKHENNFTNPNSYAKKKKIAILSKKKNVKLSF